MQLQPILDLFNWQVTHGKLETYPQLYLYALEHNDTKALVWFDPDTLQVDRIECEDFVYQHNNLDLDKQVLHKLKQLTQPTKEITIRVPKHLHKQQCEDILRSY